MEHYFTPNPVGEHERLLIEARLRGLDLRFWTDRSVFSRRELDAGSALLIQTMDVERARSIVDVGCGYGPIGIAAAKLAPQAEVFLVDVNVRAVELARDNIALNAVAKARALASDGLAALSGRRFDLALMNPPIRAGKQAVHRLIDESLEHLLPGGALWLVVGKQQGAPSLLEHLARHPLVAAAERVERDRGYHVLRAVRR